ncbi:hypothetical protein [Dactylosporangium sp. CA-139066]|uniref:hypothetical protein n=1 Tax=Dactylosporangium sp. CA-139066 TaxID=3239930 RepID=UPI003D8CB7AB
MEGLTVTPDGRTLVGKFLVDERDGNQGAAGAATFKNLYEIDLSGATDVNGDGVNPLGYTVSTASGPKSIDAYVGDAPTAKAELLLSQAGITPVSKTPYLEVLRVDMSKLPVVLGTATVTIKY